MSLKAKLALLLIAVVAATAGFSILATRWFGDVLLSWLLVVAASLLPLLWLASRIMRPIQQMLRALSGTVASYRRRGFQPVAAWPIAGDESWANS